MKCKLCLEGSVPNKDWFHCDPVYGYSFSLCEDAILEPVNEDDPIWDIINDFDEGVL